MTHRFIQHVECALKSEKFTNIKIFNRRKYSIELTCYTTPLIDYYARLLNISIPLREDSDASLLGMFLQNLIRLDLTNVTNLHFVANTRLNAGFGPFFSCLPSVEYMTTDLQTLSLLAHRQKKYLNKATNKPIIMFPNLKYINLPFISTPREASFLSIQRLQHSFCGDCKKDIPFLPWICQTIPLRVSISPLIWTQFPKSRD